MINSDITCFFVCIFEIKICSFLKECYDDGTAYYHNDIPEKSGRRNRQATSRGCQESCKNFSKCKFWTYDKKNKWCYLKTCRENIKSGRRERKYISGAKDCVPRDRTTRRPIPTTRPPPSPQPRCRNERRPGDVGRGDNNFCICIYWYNKLTFLN